MPAPAIDPANFDKAVRPQDDLDLFVNGSWKKNNPVPSDKSRWGTFDCLMEQTNDSLKILVEGTVNHNEHNTNVQRIGDLYASGLDTAAIEKAGTKPIEDLFLMKINGIHTTDDVISCITLLQEYGMGPLFAFGSSADDKNSNWEIAQLYQAGIGLPDRDYYLEESKKELLEQYRAHVAKNFELLGNTPDVAKQQADAVVALESKLAQAQFSRTEMRDPDLVYNKKTFEELVALVPEFKWKQHFQMLADKVPKEINVQNPKFMQLCGQILAQESMDTWKAYLTWNVISEVATSLPEAFEVADHEFYGQKINGQKEQQPRWKRVLRKCNSLLGEAIGEVYVAKHFPPHAKKSALEMVARIKEALRRRLADIEWMSADTRTKALEKMNNFSVKIGYPDKWIDYSTLTMDKVPYVLNVLAGERFAIRRIRNRFDKEVDRALWFMPPQTINAYYSPNLNEIVFPAAIMQAPFFSADADDAVNYGAMGAVIGHEMTHGFDDQGRKFDSQGNLNDWWTEEDAKNFEERAEVIVKQFSDYTFLGENIRGKLTEGENIADLGGLKLAYAALQDAIKEKGRPADIDGFTAEQRFFMSWAQAWRCNITDEKAKMLLTVDPHSPAHLRANGPMGNIAEFYEAFGVKEGDKLYIPEGQRVNIW